MQANRFSFSRLHVLSAFVLIGAIAWFASSAAHAQLVRVDGNSASSGTPAIASVVTRGAGEAQVTITGVALRPGLKYCLIGLGHGNWYGSGTKVQIEKIGCAIPTTGTVIIPLTLEAKRYETKGVVIGYIPVGVESDGKIAAWPVKPIGAVDFVRTSGQPDQAIAIRWSADGKAKVLTTAEAEGQFSD